MALVHALGETPATSLAGVHGKLRILRHEIKSGMSIDDRELQLPDSIADDLERVGFG